MSWYGVMRVRVAESYSKFLLTRSHGIALKMNDVSIESRRKRRAFRAPALFYFMVVMRAALQQNINHVKVPQIVFFFKSVSNITCPSFAQSSVIHAVVHRWCAACPGDWFSLSSLQ
ncbi:MAG: hypothetical protein ACTSUE_02605 [Promethearchaeota archaeon]